MLAFWLVGNRRRQANAVPRLNTSSELRVL
ncbi:hypothetical protein IJJ27_01370 [bacterium]|nr:hypothetical protein [bacterium]